MHPLLRVLIDEVILLRDMEQDRLGDGVLLAQQAVDADAIIADAGIHIGARRGHEGQSPAQAIADDADLEVRAMLVADRLDRRFDIANAAVLVEPAHQVKRLAHLVGNVGVQLDTGRDLVEKIGRDGQIACLGQRVALAADTGIHAEDFLDDDDRGGRLTFRLGIIGVELAFAVLCGDGLGGSHAGLLWS